MSCPNEPVEPIEKNSQILVKYSFRSKESKKEKKNGEQFWAQIREKWLKQARVLQIWMGFNELQLNWSFCGYLNLYPAAWYEPRNWPWRHFIMDQTLTLNWTIGELTWGPKNWLSPSRAPWPWHTKIGCGRHPQDTCKCQGIKLRVYNCL